MASRRNEPTRKGKDDAEKEATDLRAGKDKPDPKVSKLSDAEQVAKDHETRIRRLERLLASLLAGK